MVASSERSTVDGLQEAFISLLSQIVVVVRFALVQDGD
jgi:hypothetical protein